MYRLKAYERRVRGLLQGEGVKTIQEYVENLNTIIHLTRGKFIWKE